jgi:serine protease inhibitor
LCCPSKYEREFSLLNRIGKDDMNIKQILIERRKVAVATATLALAVTTAAPAAVAPDVDAVVKGNTTFAIDLYQKLKSQPGNMFFSPYSISTALAMTYAGARGQTETEMAKVLHVSLPQQRVHEAYSVLVNWPQQIQNRNRVTLVAANSLWCQQGYQFTDAFLNLSRTRYGAEAEMVDFVNGTDAARQKINTWVDRKTQGKIKEILSPGAVSGSTVLVLCNAVYFKGRWKTQFDPKLTRQGQFTTATSEKVTVPMMSVKSSLWTDRQTGFDILELPYAGGDVGMFILLPQAVGGLPLLERRLTAESVRDWFAGWEHGTASETTVILPRFKATCGFDLSRNLAAMGMPSAFEEATADFSGMTGSRRRLFISGVAHKAFIEVNEEGTEAAAATATVMTRGIQHDSVFVVDHPFLFLIRENRTGSILFLGRIVDPTKD